MKCLRCGNDFENPVPPITNPEGKSTEIASSEWCSVCNQRAVMLIHREDTVYYDRKTFDLSRGGIG